MPRRLWALIASAALLLSVAPTVLAGAPANDQIANAITISSVPSAIAQDTTQATSSDSDPGYCAGPELGPDRATVWFSYTPSADASIGATTIGSDYDTTLYVGTLDGTGFQLLACNDDSRTSESVQRFDAEAGVTYYFAVGTNPWAASAGGSLVFNLVDAPPAQVVDVAIDANGLLKRQTVGFHGTVSCTAETTDRTSIVVELDQGEGDTAADYIGFADIAGCPGAGIPFEIDLEQQVGKVKKGTATLQVIFAACNDWECASKVLDGVEVTIAK
jgi:hypothetical protein